MHLRPQVEADGLAEKPLGAQTDVQSWKNKRNGMLKSAIRNFLAKSLAHIIPPGIYYDVGYFNLWQSRGIHITPVSFYQPVPDTRAG